MKGKPETTIRWIDGTVKEIRKDFLEEASFGKRLMRIDAVIAIENEKINNGEWKGKWTEQMNTKSVSKRRHVWVEGVLGDRGKTAIDDAMLMCEGDTVTMCVAESENTCNTTLRNRTEKGHIINILRITDAPYSYFYDPEGGPNGEDLDRCNGVADRESWWSGWD